MIEIFHISIRNKDLENNLYKTIRRLISAALIVLFSFAPLDSIKNEDAINRFEF